MGRGQQALKPKPRAAPRSVAGPTLPTASPKPCQSVIIGTARLALKGGGGGARSQFMPICRGAVVCCAFCLFFRRASVHSAYLPGLKKGRGQNAIPPPPPSPYIHPSERIGCCASPRLCRVLQLAIRLCRRSVACGPGRGGSDGRRQRAEFFIPFGRTLAVRAWRAGRAKRSPAALKY